MGSILDVPRVRNWLYDENVQKECNRSYEIIAKELIKEPHVQVVLTQYQSLGRTRQYEDKTTGTPDLNIVECFTTCDPLIKALQELGYEMQPTSDTVYREVPRHYHQIGQEHYIVNLVPEDNPTMYCGPIGEH